MQLCTVTSTTNNSGLSGLACLPIDEEKGRTEEERALTVGDDAGQEPEAVADVHLCPPGFAVAPVPREARRHRAVPLPARHRLAQRPCSPRPQNPKSETTAKLVINTAGGVGRGGGEVGEETYP